MLDLCARGCDIARVGNGDLVVLQIEQDHEQLPWIFIGMPVELRMRGEEEGTEDLVDEREDYIFRGIILRVHRIAEFRENFPVLVVHENGKWERLFVVMLRKSNGILEELLSDKLVRGLSGILERVCEGTSVVFITADRTSQRRKIESGLIATYSMELIHMRARPVSFGISGRMESQ